MTIHGRGHDDFSAIVEFSAALLSLRVHSGFYAHEIMADAAAGEAAEAFPGCHEGAAMRPRRSRLAEITPEKAQAGRTQLANSVIASSAPVEAAGDRRLIAGK